ncbi:flagellar basal body P-ring protein FlgI [Phyllobacterium sp. 21LDTY02-6]|uniref:flagellar basal body P-ring protein FlgI n=1 Tax=Phyllobacterium sp. 21LDTY02-6 TaxID=2944903 RepID=UPI00201FF12C|nr:flagellar basal body P-ring protein FlgI [Phyllobacterium sp. 21LDTY02-6]MCO4315653.1 flagellar basal body P-ring protein FlgI [Phyllobacterium sp. 21LDTY02-6]
MRRSLAIALSLAIHLAPLQLHAAESSANSKEYSTAAQARAAFQKELNEGRWGGAASPLGEGGAIARLKDIANIQGVRDNQLVGYGLVIGLNGTGDSLRSAPFTEQSMRAMLDNLGISPPVGASRSKNIAAVIVTANLPPFAGRGSRIDVTVSSLGDATSLAGGTLVMTPLAAADGQTYAVAQGNMIVSGFSASGQAESVTEGVPTSGRIPNGALVEKEVMGNFGKDELVVELREPDFTTAVRITDTINAFAKRRYKQAVAKERDSKSIRLRKPANISATRFLAEIEGLPVVTDEIARVVVDERTGTVVIGEKVRISRVAISHGSLSVRVTETPTVVQPEPFSERGVTAVEPNTEIDATQASKIGLLGGTDLESLVKGLNQIGVKPQGIIAILQGIKTAGALHAELVVQ